MMCISRRCQRLAAIVTSIGVVTRAASGCRIASAASTVNIMIAVYVVVGVPIMILVGPMRNSTNSSTTCRCFAYLEFSGRVVDEVAIASAVCNGFPII